MAYTRNARYTLQLPNEDDHSDGSFSFFRDYHRAMLNSRWKWDVSAPWEYLWNNRESIKALAKEHGRKPCDLCLSKRTGLMSKFELDY
jgi:hypothetical protein